MLSKDALYEEGVFYLSKMITISSIIHWDFYPIQSLMYFLFCIFPQARPYFGASWITSVWEFISSIKGFFHIEDSWDIGPQRDQDINIMDLWTQSRFIFTPKIMKRLNACRIYLRVITIDDITGAHGHGIVSSGDSPMSSL